MHALSSSDGDFGPPLRNGRIRLVGSLGRGGMADVYLGYDRNLLRSVAVKIMRPELAKNASLRRRFVTEAQTMAGLEHRHVVQIFDFGEDDGEPGRMYIAMELLSTSLQAVLDRHGPLSPRLAAELMIEVTDALEVAHHRAIVHRDLKPANILVTREGSTKVGDFGIARDLSKRDDPLGTGAGRGLGTCAYAAPEQLRDARAVDCRADVYGAGATLFALVTGKEPYNLDQHLDWREDLDALPGALRDVILRCARFRREERYGAASELRAALVAALELLPPDPPGAREVLLSRPRSPGLVVHDTIVPELPPSPVGPGRPAPVAATIPISSSGTQPRPSRGLPGWVTLGSLALGAAGVVAWSGYEPAPGEDPQAARPAPPPSPPGVGIKTGDASPETPHDTATEPDGATRPTAKPGPPDPPRPRPRPAPEPEPEPVQLPSNKFSVNGQSCEVWMDGQAMLDGEGHPVGATGTGLLVHGSAKQVVPVGEHSFACEGGPATPRTLLRDGEVLTITLDPPPSSSSP